MTPTNAHQPDPAPPTHRTGKPVTRPTNQPGLRHLLLLGALAALPAWAVSPAGPLEFQGADLALGARLLKQHQCAECHMRQVGGDGSAIYKPSGRINRPEALLSMVERCSTQLNLQLFPEDIAAVAAVLQRDHYHFK